MRAIRAARSWAASIAIAIAIAAVGASAIDAPIADAQARAHRHRSRSRARAPRLTPASVYDPTGHRMITWSGQGPGVFFNDVWAFDLTTNTWSQFSPAGGPPQIRYGVGYTWDPLAKDLVTFAGLTNLGRFDDVWRFHAAPATWTNVSPVTNPLARCLHAACYDAQNHRMIMYAGQDGGGRGAQRQGPQAGALVRQVRRGCSHAGRSDGGNYEADGFVILFLRWA